jgi:hypothetical protein
MSSFINRLIISRKKSPSKAQTSTMKNIFKRSLANFRQSRARIHDVAIELSTPRSDTPTERRHRTATSRTATPTETRHRTATPRSDMPTETRQISATRISATPISAAPRSTTPSVRRHVQQEALDKLNTMRGESTALETLKLKKFNTQDKILKKSAQILKLEQKFRDAKKKAEKDEFARQIKILKALKLALKQELAEITIELRSTMETIQKYSKKGGTRKRRKYEKKH